MKILILLIVVLSMPMACFAKDTAMRDLRYNPNNHDNPMNIYYTKRDDNSYGASKKRHYLKEELYKDCLKKGNGGTCEGVLRGKS